MICTAFFAREIVF